VLGDGTYDETYDGVDTTDDGTVVYDTGYPLLFEPVTTV